MKKITLLLNRFVLVFLLGLASMTAMAQFSGPKADAIVTLQPDLTGLCHGATVHVPIYITANNVLGMDFYIEFDHTVLTRAEDSVANVYPGFNVVYNYVYHPLYPNVLYLGLNNPSFIGTNFTGQKLIDLVFIYNGEGSATSTPIHLRTAGDVIPPPTCVLFDADGGVIPAQYISNTVSGFPLPTATLSGGGTICAGASVDLNVAFTGTAPWTITYTDGTTPVTVSGITANPYTLTVTPEATATYTISNVTDGNLCSNVGTGSAAILVNPLPTATISGGTAICPGGSATISVDLTGTAPWNFTYFDGTAYTPVTGVMTTPYTFLVAPTATTTYTITEVTDANLCMNTGTGSAEIIVNALPTAEISGTTGICPGGSATLSIALTGAQPWDFTYTDGTTPVTITGNILNPYTFDVNPIVNTTYNVLTVTDGNLCTNTGTGSATVSINAVPTATIAGSQTICYGEEATLSVVLTGTAPWGFTYTDGTTEVSITGVNDPLYTFNVAPTTTSTFTITQVVDGNLCTNTGTGDAFVWVNPLPVVAFEGTYGPYNLTDPAVTLVATPAGGTFSGNGVSGDQFTPAVAGGGWHVITYTYTDGNGCTNSTNISITVYAGTVTLQPDLTGLCGGETILVPIYLTGNNIAGMDFYIEYDHSVLSMGTPPGWTNLYPGFSATYNYVYNPAYPNLSFLSLNNPSMIGVDFTGQKIIDLVFTYNGGTTPIHLRTLPDATPPPLCALYDDNGAELAPTSYIDNMVDGSPALMVGDIADNQTICAGEIPALLTSTGPLNGTDPTYQWQVSGDGINFTNIDGAIGTDYQPAALNITTFYRQLQDADATCGGPLPTNSITIVVNPLPMGTISGSQTICAGSSATLTVDLTGTAPWEITYTDGTTPVVVPGILDTPYLFDVTPGMTTNYTLLNVTDVNLCSTTGTGNALVEVTPLPMATISGSQTICTGSEATLAVDFTGTSPWEITLTDGTTPIVVPGITENPYMFEVNPVETTTYSILNVTDATLCSNTGTGEALVEVFPLPMATISGSQTICAGSSATLAVDLTGTAPWEITYTDGTTPVVVPGILDTPYLFDVTPGITTTYTLVNVTDGNLCSNVGTGEALVAVNPLPMATISGSQTICAGSSATLTVDLTGTAPWDIVYTDGVNPVTISGIAATPYNFDVTPTMTSNYTITSVVDGNLCSNAGSGNALVGVIPLPEAPVVVVTDNCGYSTLTASGYTGDLLWSTGEITPTITVTLAGVYTVTQTVGSCTSLPGSGTASPIEIPVAPVVTVADFCGYSTLTATGYTGDLLWSTGETTPTITVTLAGVYTVTQTVNGCTSPATSGNANPLVVPVAPVVTVADFCGYSTLTASGYTGDLLWSTGEATPTITVTMAGVYTVTQTVGGCTSLPGTGTANPMMMPAAPVVVVADNCGYSTLTATNYTGTLLWSTGETTPTITVTLAGIYTVTQTVGSCTSLPGSGTASPIEIPVAPVVTVSDFCGYSTLTATGYTGDLLWSTGETTPTITVTLAGVYTVTQTVNGCTSLAGSGNANPLVVPVAPVVTVADFCGYSTLTASGYTGDLLWSTGETTPTITVTLTGVYTVTQTVGGCTSLPGTGTANPMMIPDAPVVTVSDFCGYSTLTASGYTGDLLWSTGETTPTITVTLAGVYTVTQTVGSCTSLPGSGTASPIEIPVAPVVTVTDFCGYSTLTATGYTGDLMWSTGETTPTITVTLAGVYTVTQTVNGCTSLAGSGNANPLVVPVAPVVTVADFCGYSTLTASGYTGDLLWSTGETTPTITVTVAGVYTVTQTVGGCTSLPGSGDANPLVVPAAPVVTVSDFCGYSTLTASAYTGDLLWSTGETTPTITVTIAGIYTVTQTVGSCTSLPGSGTASPIEIPVAPVVTVSDFCGYSTLTATGYTGDLLWSTGETTPTITVTIGGVYTVTQTVSGCTSLPGAGIANPLVVPATPVVSVLDLCGYSILTASGYTGTLLWSTGETTPSIAVAVAGTYTVTQTVGACTSLPGEGIANPLVIPPAPVVTVEDLCESSVLTASGYTGTLLWSTGETTPSITVTESGIYWVTQTVNGCTSQQGLGEATPHDIPETPVITKIGLVLFSSSPVGNQWYYEGTLIEGATNPTYTVTHNTGYYSVMVTINGCSSEMSEPVWVDVVGVPEIPSEASFTIYPVPNNGLFTASILYPTDETFDITVYNQNGARIYEMKDVKVTAGKFEQQIDLRPVPSGIYSIVFSNSEHKVIRKLVVNR